MNHRQSTIRVKRVYEAPEEADGNRILVDRLWPRGLSKGAASVDTWLKDIAPSTELRRWYDHDPDKWAEFRQRYTAELEASPENVARILKAARAGTITFLYSSKEGNLNNAVALKDYIESIIEAKTA